MTSTTTRRPTLAVVAIAKNEERDIPHFLNHLLPWVDEIVIVDNGSTDRTLELLHAAGDRVRVLEQQMDPVEGFAGLRNCGIDSAKSDWLLHMDIDERVTPQLADEIRHAIADTDLNGFRYHRLNFFLHRPMRGGGWQYWNHSQLGRRGQHRFVNPIHEACIIDGGEERTGQLAAEMWHFNDEDYVERVNKNLNYMQMSGQQILDKGFSIRWYHILLHPAYRALKSYFLQGGFREGTRGLLLALYTFSGTFNWWAYAWDRQNRISRESLEQKVHDNWIAHENRKDDNSGHANG